MKLILKNVRRRIADSPALVRVVPFLVFAGLTALQGKMGEGSHYWLYAVKTLAGAGMILAMRPLVEEMRWKLSWEAVAAGVLVFGIWVGLDSYYPKWRGSSFVWNPHDYFGAGTGMAWMMIWVRVIGATLVVPPLEEVVYRSFLYRYVARSDFERVPFSYFAWTPFLVTSAIFGLAHFEWVAGVLCGAAFQMLVVWKGRIGDAMTAHAITNFLLGLWVVGRGAWHFW